MIVDRLADSRLESARLGRSEMRRVTSILSGLNLLLLFATSLWFRVIDLENIPGINGDEAWCGVQAIHCLAGENFKIWTPTGHILNPFFFGIELPLLLVFPPSF